MFTEEMYIDLYYLHGHLAKEKGQNQIIFPVSLAVFIAFLLFRSMTPLLRLAFVCLFEILVARGGGELRIGSGRCVLPRDTVTATTLPPALPVLVVLDW